MNGSAQAGTSGLEKWVINILLELQGGGITMKGSDTSFIEKTKLLIKEGHIYYVADAPGNRELIFFKLVSINDDEFTCEKPAHDFPKKLAIQEMVIF